jgi:hypothetical protein
MGETKLTAHLPAVDVEITRRELPEQHAQALTIQITATPSFDAVGQWLLQADLLRIAPAFSMWAEFMQQWQRAWYPLLQPWLLSGSPAARTLEDTAKNHR